MMTRFSAALRVYLSGSILVTSFVAAADPFSQHAFAMSEDGFGGVLAIGLMAALAIAGLLDAVINDFLPDRYSIQCTHRHRHVVFMLIAIGQVAIVLALVRADEVRPAISVYLWDAAFAVWVAVQGVIGHAEIVRQSASAARARDTRIQA